MSQNNDTRGSTAGNVLAEVAEQLKTANDTVRTRLRDALVERELSKRVDLLDKGLAKLRELKREVDKVRPPVSYTLDGQKVEGNLDKATFETLKKAREKVTKLEAALEKAFAGQEFDKLSNLVAGKEAPAEEQSE